jgi:hypothetical protein
MAIDERKQRILEHLALTSNNMDFQSRPLTLDFTPPPPTQDCDRIIEHLSRTSTIPNLSANPRKQLILKHVRKTMG